MIQLSEVDMSKQQTEVPYGTLDLLILKTLETMGKMHGYAIARRIEQVCGEAMQLSQGSVYPALIRLQQEGWIGTDWGTFGDQPEGEVLLAHGGGAEAGPRGGGELGEGYGAGGALSGGVVMTLRRVVERLFALAGKRRLDGELDDEILRPSGVGGKRGRGARPVAGGGAPGGAAQFRRHRTSEGRASREPQFSMDRNAGQGFRHTGWLRCGGRRASRRLWWACWRSALGPTSPCSAWWTPCC